MTTNEMIYKTLTTKLTKTPVYKSVLEDFGYEVFDSNMSNYGNWAIKNKKTGRIIVISKGYDNKRGLFNPRELIETNDMKKVDYVGYLSKKETAPAAFDSGEYHAIRAIIRQSKSMISFYERRINIDKEQLKEIKSNIKRHKDQRAEYEDRLINARKKVTELKRKCGMIKEVYAVYTGGNIWLFYGQLKSGNYFLTDDNGWTQIVDADPSNFDESLFEEWQHEHLIKELHYDERVKFCNHMLDVLTFEDSDHKGGITDQEIEAYRTWFESEVY